jgi:hypothetical protein
MATRLKRFPYLRGGSCGTPVPLLTKNGRGQSRRQEIIVDEYEDSPRESPANLMKDKIINRMPFVN